MSITKPYYISQIKLFIYIKYQYIIIVIYQLVYQYQSSISINHTHTMMHCHQDISPQSSPCHQTAPATTAAAAMLGSIPAMQLTMVILIPTLDLSKQRILWVLGSNLPPTSLCLAGAKQDVQPHAPMQRPFLTLTTADTIIGTNPNTGSL